MSRTFRRINETQEHYWILRNWDLWFKDTEVRGCANSKYYQLDPKSKEGKEALAKYHSDKYRSFKEPGPAWYRHMWVEKPQRREVKRQLNKFMLDEEFEVILESKPPLPYWT